MSKAKREKKIPEINSEKEIDNPGQQESVEASGLERESPDPDITARAGVAEAEEEREADWENRYLRIAAEYDNYRRRSRSELEFLFQDATCTIVCELLPVLDSFDSALNMEGEANPELDESDLIGISLMHKQLINALNKVGVEEIKALGEKFDPNLHQAVMSIEDEEAGDNEIVEVFQKGYKNGNRVIRHSMVKVAN